MKQKINFKQFFKNYPDIQAVYLFGSSVTGREHDESDVDLAIVPRDQKVREKKLSILTELAREGLDNIDIVFLDTDDIVTKYEAVRQNRIVYQTNDFDRGAMYSITVRRYLDFEPYLRVQRKALKRRILDDKA